MKLKKLALTEQEKTSAIEMYFVKKMKQQDIAEIFNVRKHTITVLCSDYANELFIKESRVKKPFCGKPLHNLNDMEMAQVEKISENAIQWHDGILTVGNYNPLIHEQFLKQL